MDSSYIRGGPKEPGAPKGSRFPAASHTRRVKGEKVPKEGWGRRAPPRRSYEILILVVLKRSEPGQAVHEVHHLGRPPGSMRNVFRKEGGRHHFTGGRVRGSPLGWA